MAETEKQRNPMRTAVLVVHGMGSQRPLQTVRGIVEAVWLDQSHPTKDQKRFWLHPELSGADVDLSVITTSRLRSKCPEKKRRVDFHELYWAHLMSETKSIAVLLWLFELGRRGPFLHPRMIALWWGGSIFLSLLILSAVFLVVWGVERLVETPDPRALLYIPLLLLINVTVLIILFCLWKRAFKFAAWAAGAALLLLGLVLLFHQVLSANQLSHFVRNFFVVIIALVAAWILMGRWGVAALSVGYFVMSLFFMALLTWLWPAEITHLPWSLTSSWSVIAAAIIIGIYLAMNAAFLKPYLGDAARYFRNSPANVQGQREIRRQAVNTLEQLHLSGKYDRIIVVAHSLGTVVAYDMLRAYFGRVHKRLPTDSPALRSAIEAIDNVEDKDLDAQTLRRNGREIVRGIAEIVERNAAGKSEEDARRERANSWLVTDFVTLGSPLTHAVYLMSHGKNEGESQEKFRQTVVERQYPTCPPRLDEDERRLTFSHKRTKRSIFHHGAVFGITRWTNLYFPMAELIWGDAIGGAIAPVFGHGIVDVKVSTFEPAADALFTHVTYWDITRPGCRDAPHIKKLRRAVNLEDDEAIAPSEAGMMLSANKPLAGVTVAPGG